MPEFVATEDVEEGMLLAEPVRNNFGQVMIPEAHQVKPQHLKLLKTWNVSGIVIKKDGEEEQKSLTPEQIKLLKSEMEEQMDWTCDFDLENDLFNTAIIHRGSKLKGKS
jgi:hypothetical protein